MFRSGSFACIQTQHRTPDSIATITSVKDTNAGGGYFLNDVNIRDNDGALIETQHSSLICIKVIRHSGIGKYNFEPTS
jgi:hypothetical protein